MSMLPPHGCFCYLHPCLLSQTVLSAPAPCLCGGSNGQFVWGLISVIPSKDLGKTEMGPVQRACLASALQEQGRAFSDWKSLAWGMGDLLWDVMAHCVTGGAQPPWAECFGTGGVDNLWEMKSWEGDAMETCLMQKRKGFLCHIHSFPFRRIPAVQACLLDPPSPANHRQTIYPLKAILPFLGKSSFCRTMNVSSSQVSSQNSSQSCINETI